MNRHDYRPPRGFTLADKPDPLSRTSRLVWKRRLAKGLSVMDLPSFAMSTWARVEDGSIVPTRVLLDEMLAAIDAADQKPTQKLYCTREEG